MSSLLPGKTPKPQSEYMSPDGTPIEEKDHLRDLGVQIGTDLTFSIHIHNTVAAANKLIGWALRTFRRTSTLVMMTIWKTLIQTKLEYCSQVCLPVTMLQSPSWREWQDTSLLRLQDMDSLTAPSVLTRTSS